ncbi:MAG: EAL domain-containing protein, partial [Lachnospiraceae bacterium]|nr:EAL domain-containing protein [Lachnospiraceae bacterium]
MLEFLYTPGRYNLNFNICAILMDLLILFFFLSRKRARDYRTRLFVSLMVLLIISAAAQNANALVRNGLWDASNPVRTLVTVIAHYFHNSLSFLLTLYLLEILESFRNVRRRDFCFIAIPQMVLSVFELIPPLRRLIYYYDAAGVYHHGPAYSVVYYGIVIAYLIIGACILLGDWNYFAQRDLRYVIYVTAGFVLSMMVSWIDSYLRVTIFLQSLCMLGVYVNIENDRETFEEGTSLMSKNALMRETKILFEGTDYTSYIISVRIRKNDLYEVTMGEDITSGLIRTINSWMSQLSADRVHVYHLSKLTFAVMMFNSTEEKAQAMAEMILNRFNREWEYKDTPAVYSAQVLIGSVPYDISRSEQMLVFADRGFDANLPTDRVLYADEVMKADARRAVVEVAVNRALVKNTFEVFYQPIFDTSTGRIHSCEALVRMKDKDLGYVSPEEFIKIAEQAGMVGKIGEIVLEKVCKFISEKKPKDLGIEFIEVNLSTIQCMDTDLPDRFAEIMKHYGVSTDQINLEITESAVISSESTMDKVLNRLLQMGFSFSLDDFGTGNSNYSYIMKYPFSIIKVDKSFLWNSFRNHDNEVLFNNMIELIHGL